MLTEQFEESLAVFMRMFNWRPIDMTYCRYVAFFAYRLRESRHHEIVWGVNLLK